MNRFFDFTRYYTSEGKGKATKFYRAWADMKSRCYNPKNISYKNYGAKGITVCQRWLDSFEDYVCDIWPNGYIKGLSVDRIDSSKGYYPDNVRLATRKQQNQNVRGEVGTSGYRGVRPVKGSSKWAAYIKYGDKQTHLGMYECKDTASMVYNEAALKHFGKFAVLNENILNKETI